MYRIYIIYIYIYKYIYIYIYKHNFMVFSDTDISDYARRRNIGPNLAGATRSQGLHEPYGTKSTKIYNKYVLIIHTIYGHIYYAYTIHKYTIIK